MGQSECRILYPDIYKCGCKHGGCQERKHQQVYLFSLDCFNYFVQYMSRKNQNQMKGLGRGHEHK